MLEVVFSVLAILLLYIYFCRGQRGIPGPWGFPIIGHIPLLGAEPHISLTAMSKKYGSVYRIRLGKWPTIVISGEEAIREALVEKGDAFAGRPPFFSLKLINEGNSFTFSSSGLKWKIRQKVAQNALRNFVNYRLTETEEIIRTETERLTNELCQETESGVAPARLVKLSVGSVIYQICFGQNARCRDDPLYKDVIQGSEDFVNFVSTGNVVDALPWTKPLFTKQIKAFKKALDDQVLMRQVNIQQHLQTFDESQCRDVTDAIIGARREMQSDLSEDMSDDWMMAMITDLIGAGLQTTSTTITWLLLYVTLHDDIQAKLHSEIDNVLGSRAPTWEDRRKMPYMEATLLEILRHSSIVPFTIPHMTLCDTTLQGYNVKADTVVFVNMHSVNHDETVWKSPEIFQPERFLLDSGKIDTSKANRVMSFGVGKRRCVGEYLANVELFIVSSSLLQKCTFKKLKTEKYDTKGIYGLDIRPKPYKIIVTPR